MNERPFEKFDNLQVVAPSDFSSLNEADTQQSSSVVKLIEEHRAAIERELGCNFVFVEEPDMSQPMWLIGPYRCNPSIAKLGGSPSEGPELFLDRKKGLLVTDGSDPAEVTETYSYLRSLNRFEGGTWKIEECVGVDEIVDRVVQEVGNSYPSFSHRKLDWNEVCEKHILRVKAAEDKVAALQEWLAELQDAHTWVRPFPPFGELPYDLIVSEGVGRFYNIPIESKAWKLGVRPGDMLLGQDYHGWWDRTAASPHSKPWIVGKRVLSSDSEQSRHLKVETVSGKIIEWEERPLKDRWNPAVEWNTLKSGNGYLRVQAWMLGKGIEEKIDEAFDAFRDCPKLIVDLRSSPGGNLLMAHRFRNRFLKKSGTVGWIQNTLPDGTLSDKESINGEMAPEHQRWHKPVVFLTDALTYSASEDVMLGLQGLDHVKVVGHPSGGGSGRMRILRLLPGYRLTVSTSLTYDNNHHCIEGNGIPVDEIVDPSKIDIETL